MTANPLDKLKQAYPIPSQDNSAWKQLKQSPEFLDTLCEAVGSRQSVMEFCRTCELSYTSVQAWLRNGLNEEQQKKYESARQVRAASYAERIDAILYEMERGEILAKEAKVQIDSLLQLAKVMDPHIWGDKLQVQSEVKTTVEMHLEGVKELADLIRKGDFTGTVIEGTVEPKLMLEKELME